MTPDFVRLLAETPPLPLLETSSHVNHKGDVNPCCMSQRRWGTAASSKRRWSGWSRRGAR